MGDIEDMSNADQRHKFGALLNEARPSFGDHRFLQNLLSYSLPRAQKGLTFRSLACGRICHQLQWPDGNWR
jgi:hypothetical protein